MATKVSPIRSMTFWGNSRLQSSKTVFKKTVRIDDYKSIDSYFRDYVMTKGKVKGAFLSMRI